MKQALLVIDFINHIVHENSPMSQMSDNIIKHQVISKANRVINQARLSNLPIIFVKVGFSPTYEDCPKYSPIFSKAADNGFLKLGEWGTAFHPELAFDSQKDLVVVKQRVSAFYATHLEAILRANQVEELILTGVSTDMAVQLTAREAHDRDYAVTIIGDACRSADDSTHNHTLQTLNRIAQITDSEQWIENVKE